MSMTLDELLDELEEAKNAKGYDSAEAAQVILEAVINERYAV